MSKKLTRTARWRPPPPLYAPPPEPEPEPAFDAPATPAPDEERRDRSQSAESSQAGLHGPSPYPRATASAPANHLLPNQNPPNATPATAPAAAAASASSALGPTPSELDALTAAAAATQNLTTPSELDALAAAAAAQEDDAFASAAAAVDDTPAPPAPPEATPAPPADSSASASPAGSELAGSYVKLGSEYGAHKGRKAYVFKYMEAKKRHVLIFCDAKGGQAAAVLPPGQFTTLNANQTAMLRKRLGLSENVPAPNIRLANSPPPRGSARDSEAAPAGTAPQTRTAPPPPKTKAGPTPPPPKPRASTSLPPKVRKKRLEPPQPKPATATRPRAKPRRGPVKSAGAELVGSVLAVRWPMNGNYYDALVVGFRPRALSSGIHKLYYVESGDQEEADLSRREWKDALKQPWGSGGLVGKRIVMYWPVGELGDEERVSLGIPNDPDERTEEDNARVPYEAFVIGLQEGAQYSLLYTADDSLEERYLKEEVDAWDVLHEGVSEARGKEVISWSNANA